MSARGILTHEEIIGEHFEDGTGIFRSSTPLGDFPATVAHVLRARASEHPDRMFVGQREPGGGWRTATYAQIVRAADSVGQSLLDLGLGPDAPLQILAENSIEHLILTFAGYTVGVPVVPLSTAYSLRSRDHLRLSKITATVAPGMIYATDGAIYRHALTALSGYRQLVMTNPHPGQLVLDDLLTVIPREDVNEAFDALTPDTLAKVMFTSGSTSEPKGVLTTHRMLCANQQMLRQVWPFVTDVPPTLTDWLPWSHTFGGSHNVDFVLYNGGSLFIDEGRPDGSAFATTLNSLRDHPPTVLVNVPAGYTMLVHYLQRDPDLAARVLSRVSLIVCAGADMPATLRTTLVRLAGDVTGREVTVVCSWGTTETAPAATSTYGAATAGIGIPLPGVALKLVPTDGVRYEARVSGPNVTAGYLGSLGAEAFDDEGFYRTGDAVKPVDEGDPRRGWKFDGRISEDFKLSTGTWVNAAELRRSLLEATTVVSDAVIVGADQHHVSALVWLTDGVDTTAAVRRELSAVLAAMNRGRGSASSLTRVLIADEPPSVEDGEITDKGYINRQIVCQRRRELVDLLNRSDIDPSVITPDNHA